MCRTSCATRCKTLRSETRGLCIPGRSGLGNWRIDENRLYIYIQYIYNIIKLCIYNICIMYIYIYMYMYMYLYLYMYIRMYIEHCMLFRFHPSYPFNILYEPFLIQVLQSEICHVDFSLLPLVIYNISRSICSL